MVCEEGGAGPAHRQQGKGDGSRGAEPGLAGRNSYKAARADYGG